MSIFDGFIKNQMDEIMEKEDLLWMYFLSGTCPHCKHVNTSEVVEVWRCTGMEQTGNMYDRIETRYTCPACKKTIHRDSVTEEYSGKKPDEGIKLSSKEVPKKFTGVKEK